MLLHTKHSTLWIDFLGNLQSIRVGKIWVCRSDGKYETVFSANKLQKHRTNLNLDVWRLVTDWHFGHARQINQCQVQHYSKPCIHCISANSLMLKSTEHISQQRLCNQQVTVAVPKSTKHLHSTAGVDNNASTRCPNLTWRHMTLTFHLLTPEVDHSCPCRADHMCQFALKLVYFLFQIISFTSLVTE